MLSAFPGQPRILKGALASLDPLAPLASVIVFQYNPERLSRTLQPLSAQGGDQDEALRLRGAPIETIQMEVQIEALDQVASGHPVARSLGLYPQISALEMLVTPKAARVVANASLMSMGTLEIIPPAAPLTVLVWGPRRVVPVRVQSLAVTEEAYDNQLNPVRARVDLGLRVLTYDDLPPASPGYGLYLANQMLREAMASLVGVEAAATALLSGGSLFQG